MASPDLKMRFQDPSSGWLEMHVESASHGVHIKTAVSNVLWTGPWEMCDAIVFLLAEPVERRLIIRWFLEPDAIHFVIESPVRHETATLAAWWTYDVLAVPESGTLLFSFSETRVRMAFRLWRILRQMQQVEGIREHWGFPDDAMEKVTRLINAARG